MTKEQAIEELIKAQHATDTEGAHLRADRILCILLISLDMWEVVDEWEKVNKWFA